MTSFNSNTKMALMMVFKNSQPTTFQCSKCVIQCNNLAEMPAQELSRLTEFLGKVPYHPRPIAEDEAHSNLTTTPSADKIQRIGTGDSPKSIPVACAKIVTKGEQSMASSALSSTDTSFISQTEVESLKNCSAFSIDESLRSGLGSDVAPTQPSNNQISMTSTSSACMERGNLQSIGVFSSDTAQISQASSQVDTSPERNATQDKVIDTTYPIALVDLSSANQSEKLPDELQRQLPGKTIMSFKDIQELACNWHLFEAVLVDFGSLQEAASNRSDEYKGTLDIYQKCQKEMLVPQNLAQLMLAPANTPSDPNRALDTISQFPKLYEVPVFQYSSESCRPSLFDDDTKNQLVSFLLDSCERYHTAVNKKGPGNTNRVKKMVKDWLERIKLRGFRHLITVR